MKNKIGTDKVGRNPSVRSRLFVLQNIYIKSTEGLSSALRAIENDTLICVLYKSVRHGAGATGMEN